MLFDITIRIVYFYYYSITVDKLHFFVIFVLLIFNYYNNEYLYRIIHYLFNTVPYQKNSVNRFMV